MKPWRRKCRVVAGVVGLPFTVAAEPDDGHVLVSWVWDGEDPDTTWEVDITFNAGVSWENIASALPAARTFADDSRLTPGEQPVQYRVTANSAGPSGVSNVVNVDIG